MTNGKGSSPLNMPYLPDDLLLICLARVSRLYYPTLSLVSKRLRTLVASLELYKTRTLLGRTEECLYVCLRFSSEDTPRWFTLCRRPSRNPNPNPKSRWSTPCIREKEKESSENLMVSVPNRNHSPPFWWAYTAIGSNIYMIGEYINGDFSSRVLFMDCRSHTWHEAPSMRMARKEPLVSVLDGKIYVVEGCKNPDSSNFIESFDPKTQIWECVPGPRVERRRGYISISRTLVLDGKLYLFGDKNYVYKPNEKKWDVLELLEMDVTLAISSGSSCVIDNVIYYYGGSRLLLWYDLGKGPLAWRALKGLEQLPKLPKRVRLVDYGGKMAVLWEQKGYGINPKEKRFWCAEIALERRNGEEIYGKIEWCDVVLTLSEPYDIVQVITVTV